MQVRKSAFESETMKAFFQVWETLKAHHLSFDVVVLDQTYGIKADSPSHMISAVVVETIARMNAQVLFKPGARGFANRIGHLSNPVHRKLAEFAATHGYEVAYDGLTIDLCVQTDTGASAMNR